MKRRMMGNGGVRGPGCWSVWIASLVVAGAAAGADEGDQGEGRWSFEETADRLWEVPELYRNRDNPVVQEFSIRGRYHGQWHSVDAGDHSDSGWENRRVRLGFAGFFFDAVELKGNFNLRSDLSGFGRVVENLDGLTVGWKAAKGFEVVAGKTKQPVTLDWSTSSRTLLTFERSLLVNQVVPGKLWGVNATGEVGRFEYGAGWALGALDDDWGWPDADGGNLLWASVAYDYRKAIDAEEARLRLDWLFNDGNRGNRDAADYRHLVSLNTVHEWDRWGLGTDLIYAAGLGDRPDVYGLVLVPFYDLGESLRLVLRYQWAASGAEDGLDLQSRYERRAVGDGESDEGNHYHAVYLGLNYYLYGDRLKLMTGAEWSTLGGEADYRGWTLLGGVRLFF